MTKQEKIEQPKPAAVGDWKPVGPLAAALVEAARKRMEANRER